MYQVTFMRDIITYVNKYFFSFDCGTKCNTGVDKNKSTHNFSSSWEVSFSALKQYWGETFWCNFVCGTLTCYFAIFDPHHQRLPKWTAISPTEPHFQARIRNDASAMYTRAHHRPHRAQMTTTDVQIICKIQKWVTSSCGQDMNL